MKNPQNHSRKKKGKLRLDRLALLLGGIFLCLVLIAGLWTWAKSSFARPAAEKQEANMAEPAQTPSSEKAEDRVLVTATGDVLLEEAILNYFGSGDWKGYMDDLKPVFEADDLTIANQEVPIGGEELGIEGIDFRFNAPKATAANLREAGIDFVSLANNHAMDRGLQGIINTHQNLDEAGIAYTGTWTQEEQADDLTFQEVNGLKLAIISFTYDCNQPIDPEWSVNVFGSAYDERSQRLIEQISQANEQADAVLVCIHWGTEFTYDLSEDQVLLAQAMADAGADVIIGNHPHTVQPAEWLTSSDGRQVLCFYSLGNLVSSAYQVDRASELFQNMYEAGAIAQFTLEKQDGNVVVADPRIIPVVNHFEGDYSNFRLMKLKDYTDEMSERHDQHAYSDSFSATLLKQQMHEVFDPSGIELDLD